MKKITLSLAVLFTCLAGFSQESQCDKCLLHRITLFDADIKVPQQDSNFALYEKLEWPAKFANAEIFNHDPSRNCWFFIDKALIDGKVSTGNQPAPAGDLAGNGQLISNQLSYLVSTSVTGTGENCKMVMALQTACDRKTIATSEVAFSWNDNDDALLKAGEQAAQQLMPIGEKVMDYARTIRETNTQYMLSGSGGEIKVAPKKTKLGIGEETEVEIQVIDCDGYLLKNRKVSFTKEMVNGLLVNGTEGGIVTPSSVVTDGQGKAKVKFKLTRTDGNATIYAHFTGTNPSGCNDVVFGAAHIGSIPVEISLTYMYHSTEEGDANPKLLHQVQTSLGLAKLAFKVHTLKLLYYPAQPLKNDFTIAIPADEEEKPVKVKYLKDDGFYLTDDKATGNLAGLAMDGSFGTGDRERYVSGIADSTQHTFFKLDWNETDFAELQIEFFYKPTGGSDYDNDPMKDPYFFRNSKGASFIKNKVTDKNSPYKWEYVIKLQRLDRITGNNVLGTVMSYGATIKEEIEMKLLSPYE